VLIKFDILVSIPKANLFCAYHKKHVEVSLVEKATLHLTVNQAQTGWGT